MSFNELQVVDLYKEYKRNPDVLRGMLLFDDGIVKGIINGQLREENVIEITDFYVDPFFVGQGIGTLLIKQMLGQVKSMGFKK